MKPFRENVNALRVPYLRTDDPTPEQLRECIARQECWWCGASGFKVLAHHTRRIHGIGRSQLLTLAVLTKKAKIADPDYSSHLATAMLPHLRTLWPDAHSKKGRKISLSQAGRIALDRNRKPHPCSVCGREVRIAHLHTCSRYCAAIGSAEGRRKGIAANIIAHRRPHPCPGCGTMLATSRPRLCGSKQCLSAVCSIGARKREQNKRARKHQPKITYLPIGEGGVPDQLSIKPTPSIRRTA